MARNFNGSSDVVTLSIGGAAAFAPGTVWAIIRLRGGDATQLAIIQCGSSLTVGWRLRRNTANTFGFVTDNNTFRNSTTAFTSANAWLFVCVTKGNTTVAPRFHFYEYATRTWTHEAGSGTLQNGSAGGTSWSLGALSTGANFFNGDMAGAGFIGTALSDQQVEHLAFSCKSWVDVNSKAAWLLDQAAVGTKIRDFTGGGADESAISGTTISADSPAFNIGGFAAVAV